MQHGADFSQVRADGENKHRLVVLRPALKPKRAGPTQEIQVIREREREKERTVRKKEED